MSSVDKKTEIIEYLQDELKLMELVQEAHIIGSFVDSDIYNDIDVIILFRECENLRLIVESVKKFKLCFLVLFKMTLHVSSFTSKELTNYNLFKSSNVLIELYHG